MAKSEANLAPIVTVLAIGGAIVAFGIWLESRPNCSGGCQTIAQHLIEHGIADIVKAIA